MSALISHAQLAAGNVGSQLQRTAGSVGNQLQTTTNRLLPPRQREQKIKELRAFANRNPKLATFLASQTALLAIPLFLFTSFALSTLFISLATGLLFAITTAFIYTFFAVGVALLFLIPTLFLASCAASCFFLWGLAVYFILQRFNEGEAPAKPGTRVGDKLHGLTGGRLGWMVGGEDEKAVEVGHAQMVLDTTGDKKHQGNGVASHQGDSGLGNGSEWETKWVKEQQRRQEKHGLPEQLWADGESLTYKRFGNPDVKGEMLAVQPVSES